MVNCRLIEEGGTFLLKEGVIVKGTDDTFFATNGGKCIILSRDFLETSNNFLAYSYLLKREFIITREMIDDGYLIVGEYEEAVASAEAKFLNKGLDDDFLHTLLNKTDFSIECEHRKGAVALYNGLEIPYDCIDLKIPDRWKLDLPCVPKIHQLTSVDYARRAVINIIGQNVSKIIWRTAPEFRLKFNFRGERFIHVFCRFVALDVNGNVLFGTGKRHTDFPECEYLDNGSLINMMD